MTSLTMPGALLLSASQAPAVTIMLCRAAASGIPNCLYHAEEPACTADTGGPFGDAVWPCCDAVGFKNSKYHSESSGKPSHYLDKPVDAAVWGCAKGARAHHCPAPMTSSPRVPHQAFTSPTCLDWPRRPLKSQSCRVRTVVCARGQGPCLSAEATDAAALRTATWLCFIVDELSDDVERHKLHGDDVVTCAPWRRLCVVKGLAHDVTASHLREACGAFGKLVAVYPRMQVLPARTCLCCSSCNALVCCATGSPVRAAHSCVGHPGRQPAGRCVLAVPQPVAHGRLAASGRGRGLR